MSRLMSNLFGKRARRSPYFLTVPKDSNIFWLPVLEAVNFLEKEQAIDFAHRLVVLLVVLNSRPQLVDVTLGPARVDHGQV